MDTVTVVKRKRPVGTGRWQAYVVETDAYGTWVFTPAHSTYVGDDGRGGLASCEVAQDSEGRGRHSLVLLPATGWFVAYWVLDAEHLVSVDISTPPKRSGSEWAFDDLELDPFVRPDGTFGVEDEDEFALAGEAGLISDAENSAAMDAVEWLRGQLTSRGSPFVATGRRLLAGAAGLGLAPLTESVHREEPRP